MNAIGKFGMINGNGDIVTKINDPGKLFALGLPCHANRPRVQ